MNPENVCSAIFLNKNNDDFVTFKTAIKFAETGLSVWIISQEAFEKVPDNISPPEKEILQLITFIYLNDVNKLITHMNGVHIWHKIPSVVIIKGLDEYCEIYNENYNQLKTAFTITSILDGIGACAKKKNRACYLLMTCTKPNEEYCNRIKILFDMYFSHLFDEYSDNNLIVDLIVDNFQKFMK